jgi:transporter family-2 protein
MINLLPVIIIAVIGGIAIALQAHLMGLLDKGVGTLETVFITYGSGGLMIGLAMLLARGGNLSAVAGMPWYTLTVGVLGLIIVGAISFATPRLGLVTALTILVASQFIVGAMMDHFGLLGAEVRQLDISRLGGVVIMLVGVWLVVR